MELTAQTALDPDEVGFLALSATAITLAAQVANPTNPFVLVALVPSILVFVFQGRFQHWPIELRAAAVSLPIYLVTGVTGEVEVMVFLSVIMLLYLAAGEESPARALGVAVVLAVGPAVIAIARPEENVGWVPWSFAHLFTYSMGRLLHRQRQLITELAQARQALADQAVAEERRRIARELHDVAGHTLAAMLLHVTGARHVLRRDTDEAERALRDAEEVGRSSLDAIRDTVAALRTDETGTDPAVATTAGIDGLVEEYRRAGLAVEADLDPAVDGLSGPVATALHRIAGEALANVARHAPTNQVRVTALLGPGDVRLSVVDRGAPPPPADPAVAHFGLVGMGERARALGGDLRAGATGDGWRVVATLPVRATSGSEAR